MRAVSVWLVVCASACRFGFDAVSDGSGSSGGSGSDGARNDARVDATFTDPPGDAGICEPNACGAAGGSCVGAVCQITANGELPVQCPAGMPCRLVCDGFRFCRDGASCNGATWCEVACIGERACQAGVACGASECLVTCNGTEACESGIAATGACASHCCGSQTCAGGVGTCTRDAICN